MKIDRRAAVLLRADFFFNAPQGQLT